MNEEDKKILLGHYSILSAFSADYYKGLITMGHLGDETVITVNGVQKFVFPVKYKGRVYAIPSKIIEDKKFPIKIDGSKKIAYNKRVYHEVKKFSSARILMKKEMDFTKLVDTLCEFKTSEPLEFTIYKICNLMLYLRKGFMRCVSEAGFGKNSVPTVLKILMTDLSIINPRSAAAFEKRLINDFIVLDELTNLASAQRDLMQEALLRIGDNSPTYEKGTMGSVKLGTKDEYNISKLSVMIIYNILKYYEDCGQQDKYFDNVFQPAVKDRFLPVYFSGTIDGMQFKQIDNPIEIAKELEEDIKKFIRTIKYYQKNLEKEDKPFKLYKEYRLSKTGRIDKTFHLICQGFRLYCKDEKQYNMMVEKLYQMHLKYVDMMNSAELIEVVPLDEKDDIKPKEKQQSLK